MKYVQALVVFVFIAICFSVPNSYAGVVFQKDSFTITLPEGWIEIPQDVLAAIYKEVKNRAPNAQIPKYDYGFQLGSSQNWMEYPYVLVLGYEGSRIPEHQLESLPTIDLNQKIKDKAANMQTLTSNVSLGKMHYDKAAHIVWLIMQTDVVNVGRVQGISGLIPTETGFVQVYAYSKTADFETYLPVFRQIISGTTINPSLVYKPHWTDISPILGPSGWGQFLGKTIAGAAIGGLIGLFVMKMRKKK